VVSINGTIAVGGLAGAINLLTEAGQLLTSNGTKAVALDVGTTSKVLTANSSVADSVEWANLPTTPAGSADYGVIIGQRLKMAPGPYQLAMGLVQLIVMQPTA